MRVRIIPASELSPQSLRAEDYVAPKPTYDVARVRAFLDKVKQLPDVDVQKFWLYIGEKGVKGNKLYQEFEALSWWEKTNVLYMMLDLIMDINRRLARFHERHARELDERYLNQIQRGNYTGGKDGDH